MRAATISMPMLVLFNCFAFFLVGFVHIAGGVEAALQQDAIGLIICGCIVLIFGYTLYLTWSIGCKIEREQEHAEKNEGSLLRDFRSDLRGDPGVANELLQDETESWSNDIAFLTLLMPRLGMLGTVVGLLMAINLSAFAGKDLTEFMKQIVFQIFAGLGVAYYTTVFGLICAIWAGANHYVLEEKTSVLIRVIRRQGLRSSARNSQHLRFDPQQPRRKARLLSRAFVRRTPRAKGGRHAA